MAAELGPGGIRVYAISTSPLKTHATSGIAEFDELLDRPQAKAPMQRLVSIDNVGLATEAAELLPAWTLYINVDCRIINRWRAHEDRRSLW